MKDIPLTQKQKLRAKKALLVHFRNQLMKAKDEKTKLGFKNAVRRLSEEIAEESKDSKESFIPWRPKP